MLTNAVANAIAITIDPRARSAYQASVSREDATAAVGTSQTRSEFVSTVDRLAAIFPGAVNVRVH